MRCIQRVDSGGREGASTTAWAVILLTVLAFVLAAAGSVFSSIDMSLNAAWESSWGDFPTGVAWTDIDGDNWPDLVVAYGNDQVDRPIAVYFNSEGALPHTPEWTSSHLQTHCQISVGDLDNDGDPDLAASSLGRTSLGFPLMNQLVYSNDGGIAGEPSFVLGEANSFSCALGDPDGDGDLDVAYAQGNAASASYQKVVMYANEGGSFSTLPSWESDSSYFGVDLAFCDIDLDGDLDLALGGKYLGVAIFYNLAGVLETSPSWQTSAIVGGRQIAFGDVDGDGYKDLAVAGINESFFVFKNLTGTLETTPSWSCAVTEPSCVAWGDADGDGDLDLAGGAWDGDVRIYENNGGVLSSTPVWSKTMAGWVQQVAWGDYDQDFLVDLVDTLEGDGTKKLFHLSERPAEMSSVELNGVPLELSQYCYDLTEGWVSLAVAPSAGDTLTVVYEYSGDLDLVATASDVCLFENLRYTPPPDDSISILLLMDQDLGANYDVQDGNDNIREHLEGFGWHITTAGLFETMNRCNYSTGVGIGPASTDYLISDIPDVTNYDILCILPGFSGAPNIYGSQEALDFIRTAAQSGMTVAAWCRAVRVLAAADLLDGLDVVGHADYQAIYEAAGATYFGNDHPPIIQGNIVTSVRSKFYRTAMCMAMKTALALNRPTAPETIVPTDDYGLPVWDMLPTFTWSEPSDPDPLDTLFQYSLQIAVDSAFTHVTTIDSIWAASYSLEDSLAFATHYWWRVEACDATDLCATSDPDDFWTWTLGDLDHSHVADITDVTILIDNQFLTLTPIHPELIADLTGDCGVDISDVARLIDHLFITLGPLEVGCE